MKFTSDQQREFCDFLRDGLNKQQAADLLAKQYEDPRITATKLRSLAQREPIFDRQVREAEIVGKGSLVERLERCAVEMAVSGHWPALKFLLTTYGEQFSWARTSRVEVNGAVEIQHVAGILSRYLPPEEYEKLIEAVQNRMLEEQTIDMPLAVEA